MAQAIKSLLEQYTAAKKEMELIDYELHQFHTVQDHVKGSMDEYPYSTHSITITGIDLSVADLLTARREKLAQKRQQVEQFMAGVEDSYMASIIRLRYIHGMEWEQVADAMCEGGAHYTSSGLRSSLSRYFESCNTCNTKVC